MLRRFLPQLLASCEGHTLKHAIAAAYTTSAPKSDDAASQEAPQDMAMPPLAPFTVYTEAECTQILDLVNGNSSEDISNYEITKARVNKLQTWKTRNGPLKSLQDILMIETFSSRIAKKFYDSILEQSSGGGGDSATVKPKKAKRLRATTFVTPAIDAEQQAAIRSCVAVRIGVASVTWSRLVLRGDQDGVAAGPCDLTHWQHHDIAEKKFHLNDLVQRCLYLNHLIPAADCYVFEMPQTAQPNNNPGNADQQNINIQKAQITAVMGYALRSRQLAEQQQFTVTDSEAEAEWSEPEHPSVKAAKKQSTNVFYLRRFLTARLFNNLVGTERVSSEQTIVSMMRTHANYEDQDDDVFGEMGEDTSKMELSEASRNPPGGSVQFDAELRRMFAKSERYHREFLGQALLLNLAFVRLVLLQDQRSIAQVTRQQNPMKPDGQTELEV